jgi:cysteine desulfurase/selenocysteine lyase
VIDAVTDALGRYSAGIHRSVHFLGDESTERFEATRLSVARWLGAQEHEIIFTRNTTESLSYVAQGWPDDRRIIVSATDHHSCILAWDIGKTTIVPPLPDGSMDEESIVKEISKGDVGIVAVSHLSNVTGMSPDVRALATAVHSHGAILVLDAAQSAPHGPLDVAELDCDFLAFSGHKLGAPAGVGVLYGRAGHLRRLQPINRGGGSVETVAGVQSTWKSVPWRFESGSPAIESVFGLQAILEYLWDIDTEMIASHLASLRSYALDRVYSIPGVRVLGSLDSKSKGPLSFVIEGQSSHVLARSLSDAYGICVRSGFHCTQPLHDASRCAPSLRLSFYVYSQPEEIDRTVDALKRLVRASPR